MGRRSWQLLAAPLAGLFWAATLTAATKEETDSLAGPPPGAVAGKVMKPGGSPLSGARVILRQREQVWTALTDEKGEYCFCRVQPSGSYVLEIEMEGFAGVLDRDFGVSRLRVAVRNAILEPLSSYHSQSGSAATP